MQVCAFEIIFTYIQVPLGVILKNENVVEDMIDILDKLHDYVPSIHQNKVDIATQREVCDDLMHEILFGGDQVTRKRAETAKEGRKNDTSLKKKLKGIIPVCEDWHTKKIFLEVSYSVKWQLFLFWL